MILKNRVAIFGWLLSTIFLLFCAFFTYLLIRDGSSNIQINPPDNTNVYPPWFMPSVLAAFWIAGVAMASHMWSFPVVRVEVTPARRVKIDLKYPLRTARHQFAFAELSAAVVIESQGSESDPYFECRLQSAGGFSAIIAESSSREYCELYCRRFNEAIAKDVGS